MTDGAISPDDNGQMHTLPLAMTMSSKPQSRWEPSFKWLPSARRCTIHSPTTFARSDGRLSSVSVQQPTLIARALSPTSSRVKAIAVAAWVTRRIFLCSAGNLRSISGTRALRQPFARSWTSSTSSPFREGYQIDDHVSSISGNHARRAVADGGRGCKPVPGTTGEYHSERPGCNR